MDKQLLLENKLRASVKRLIADAHRESLLEQLLRTSIRGILKEVSKTDTKKSPHPNTAINVLEELLRNIIPILETDYKTLTSNEEQRKSYREHIANAVTDSVKPEDINASAIEKPMNESDMMPEADLSMSVNDGEDKFIDIKDQDKETSAKTEKEKFSLAGRDETGRNVAYQSFKKVETQILDAYEILSDPGDRKVFLKYLLTNLNLYFERFENDLKSQPTAAQ